MEVDGFHQLLGRRWEELEYLTPDVPVVHAREVVVDDFTLFDVGKLVAVVEEMIGVLLESFSTPLVKVSEVHLFPGRI